MSDRDLARKKRAQSLAKQDIAIWDALIGAAGQLFKIIMPRLSRAALNTRSRLLQII